MRTDELYGLTGRELRQREEEGCDGSALKALQARHAAAAGGKDAEKRAACESILAEVAELCPDPSYEEPSDLPSIKRLRPDGPRRMQNMVSATALYEKTYGGWLGRCAGCDLGKPVEGADRATIRKLAGIDGNWPIRDYLAAVARPGGIGKHYLQPGNRCTRGNITRMERDDDIDYTITGLLLLERHGRELTTTDVAEFWLSELPFHKVYTAERVAYRNLVDGVPPERAGEVRNPCREWIGAQIRADAFGYVCLAWPELAADLAYRDAFLSHRKNGIYGEMLVAAMIAAAFVESDIERLIQIGLSEIPRTSRLAEAVRRTVGWWAEGHDWEYVADRIDEHYGNLQGCHTVTNAAIVILGLLAGEEDFTAGLAASVMPGYDTDCNGATVGSILGVRAGAAALPTHWVAPLNDLLETAIVSVGSAAISEMARRTVGIAVRSISGEEAAGTPQPITWGVND